MTDVAMERLRRFGHGLKDWRNWPRRIAETWRHSLGVRTLSITILLTAGAVAVIGVSISATVANNLFQARLDQVLTVSAQAARAADTILSSSDATDAPAVQAVMNSTLRTVTTTASTDLVAVYRVPDQPASFVAPQDRESSALTGGVISDELRQQVQSTPGAQYWQSVEIPGTSGRLVPGLIVGTQIELPSTAGAYEMYLAFRLDDTEQALTYMQWVGLVGAGVLILLLGGVIFVLVRSIVRPIETAAETSSELARGNLDVRLKETGEDEIAVLARSFNRMADSIQRQIGELAELSQVQQRFVSDVSHELRTPLTTIRLAADVLYSKRDELDAESRRTVELLHTQSRRFEDMLSDLIEISRYDAGETPLSFEPTNLAQLAAGVVQDLRGLADDHGTELRLHTPGGHVEAIVEPRRIARILRNLIGNAIEHGEKRPIDITVDSNATSVGIGVRDYGIGMDKQQAAQAFDRFWRADPSRARTIGGTGLGLAISMEDALAHKGLLEVWSKPGRGSHFVVTLPRDPEVPRQGKPVAVKPKRRDLSEDPT